MSGILGGDEAAGQQGINLLRGARLGKDKAAPRRDDDARVRTQHVDEGGGVRRREEAEWNSELGHHWGTSGHGGVSRNDDGPGSREPGNEWGALGEITHVPHTVPSTDGEKLARGADEMWERVARLAHKTLTSNKKSTLGRGETLVGNVIRRCKHAACRIRDSEKPPPGQIGELRFCLNTLVKVRDEFVDLGRWIGHNVTNPLVRSRWHQPQRANRVNEGVWQFLGQTAQLQIAPHRQLDEGCAEAVGQGRDVGQLPWRRASSGYSQPDDGAVRSLERPQHTGAAVENWSGRHGAQHRGRTVVSCVVASDGTRCESGAVPPLCAFERVRNAAVTGPVITRGLPMTT